MSTLSHGPSSQAELHGGCRVSHFISFPPTACWLHTCLVLGSEGLESPSLSIFSRPVMILYLSHSPSDYLPCRQKSPSLLNPSPHGSCFLPLILPVTLLCASCTTLWARGRWEPGTMDTHPPFMEQYVDISPNNA